MLYETATAYRVAHHLLNNREVVWHTSVTNSPKAECNNFANGFTQTTSTYDKPLFFYLLATHTHAAFSCSSASLLLYPYACVHVIQKQWRVWLWEHRVPADVLKQWRNTGQFSLQFSLQACDSEGMRGGKWVWERAVMVEGKWQKRQQTSWHTNTYRAKSSQKHKTWTRHAWENFYADQL